MTADETRADQTAQMMPQTRGGASGSALPASGLAVPGTQLAVLLGGAVSKGHRNDKGRKRTQAGSTTAARRSRGHLLGFSPQIEAVGGKILSPALGWVCCAAFLIYTKVPLSNSYSSASLHTSASQQQQLGWAPRKQPGTKFKSAHNHHEITSENGSTTHYHHQPVFFSKLLKQRAVQGSCGLPGLRAGCSH